MDGPDPLEPLNRGVLGDNRAITTVAIGPVATVYQAVLPVFVRDRVSSVAGNLDEPRIFANELFQGRLLDAHNTFGRFLLNTTFGVGGLFDVASSSGLVRKEADFGQTLYTWGVDSGPYIVIPIFGPSTVRDAIGKGVDMGGDPTTWALKPYIGPWPVIGIQAANQLQRAGDLSELEAGAVDYYARLRSTYLQQRASELAAAPPPPAAQPPAVEAPPPARAPRTARRRN